jgi:hypothetical protein
MKSIKKWVRRISLSVFTVSSVFVLSNLHTYPELSEYHSASERLLGLICLLVGLG